MENDEPPQVLVLSEADRAVLFEALINPPTPSKRLERAFAAERRRVEHDGCGWSDRQDG